MSALKISDYKIPNEVDALREDILKKIKKNEIIEIDLESLESLSPTTAYRVFAKLVDDYPDFDKKIKFINDEQNLSTRITEAIKRRRHINKVM